MAIGRGTLSLGRVAILITMLLSNGCSGSINKHEKRGDGYFRAERYPDAIAEYRVALRQEPINAGVLRKLGKMHLLRGDVESAQKVFSDLLAIDESFKQTVTMDYYQFAVRSLRIKDMPDMARSLELILELDSDYELGDFFYHLGDYYYSLSEYEKAIDLLTKTVSVSTDSSILSEALYELGFSNEKIGDYEEGLINFQQLLSRYPDYHDSRVAEWHLGNCGFHMAEDGFAKSHYDDALRYLAIVIRTREPEVLQDRAWMMRGEIYYRRKQRQHALDAYNKVLELNPSRRDKIAVDAQQRIHELKFGSS